VIAGDWIAVFRHCGDFWMSLHTISSVTDSFGTLVGEFRQVADGLYGLSVALLHGVAEFGAHLLQDPSALIAGVIIGAAIGLAAWSVVSIVRNVAKARPAKAPPPGKMPAAKTQNALQTLAMPEVEKQLGSSPEGLTQAEALKRLTKYGLNQLDEKKTNVFLIFLKYFWGPIPWMIEVAVVLSAIVRHWPDFFIILVLLLANAIIGFWEERAAGNAIDALKARLAIKARVKRDGKWVTPSASQLVPGDVIRLRLGDIVPADARLLQGDEVSVDQSALTGESLPATKKAGDAVFSGSILRRGEIGALVYATGTNTYFGKTAELVGTAVTASHFQKAVMKIGDYLILLALALVSIIIAVGIWRGEPVLTLLQFALVLTVAAIPVAMPTVLSVTMAVGARLLARKKAIVSKLVAIEELAGVDVLCADKTGTLTQNKLTLGDPFVIGGVTAAQVILSGALASRADNDDTIDQAVLGGVTDAHGLQAYQMLHFTPFDPVHKRTEATIKGADGTTFKVTKGAPQVILKLAANAEAVKPAYVKAVNDFAARGFRALGVARADADGQWQLLGVLPLYDPPRTDAKSTIATARQMGVKIKMVTGDALAIAKETAKTLGMGTNILDGANLSDSKSEDTATEIKSVEDADGFAQVFPANKFHIIDILQKHSHIVGMTGDGVNDAPALKKADCGIAVSGATDAARASADIVLTTPGLSVIIDAIKESRRIFQRMNSYAMYRIAETLRVLIFMTLAILILHFYPLTAIMIVMLALFNDGAILSIAYDNVRYRNVPEAWNMRTVLSIATVLGLLGPATDFILFYVGDRILLLGHPELQTLMYLKLSVAGHLTIFQTRARGPWWSTRPAWILLAAVGGTQTAATLIAVYGVGLVTPLGWKYAGIVWGYAFFWFLVGDPLKLLTYKVLDIFQATKPQAIAGPTTASIAAPQPADKTGSKPEGHANAKTKGVAKDMTAPESHEAAKSKSATAAAPEPKPQASSEPSDKAGATPGSDANANPKGVAKAPESDEGAKSEGAAAAAPEPKAAAKSEPAPKAANSAPAENRASSENSGTLMKTIVGDLARAGLLKDPERVGHIVAGAIVAAQAPPLQPAAAPKAHSEAVAPPPASPKTTAVAGHGEHPAEPAPAKPAKGRQ
jgi:H+-transporting ATPase